MIVQFLDIDPKRPRCDFWRQAAVQRAQIIKVAFIIGTFAKWVVWRLVVDPPLIARLA